MSFKVSWCCILFTADIILIFPLPSARVWTLPTLCTGFLRGVKVVNASRMLVTCDVVALSANQSYKIIASLFRLALVQVMSAFDAEKVISLLTSLFSACTLPSSSLPLLAMWLTCSFFGFFGCPLPLLSPFLFNV